MPARVPPAVRAPLRSSSVYRLPIRTLTTQEHILPPSHPPPPPAPSDLDPNTVVSPRQERRLLRSRVFPVGSRRRRAALRSSADIPFEQLPYQCFQEARKVLAEDRKEKLEAIQVQRERLERLKAQDAGVSGGEWQKGRRVDSMQRYLERLKILADINDPMVKKRFEDGMGDMSRPIYRHLSNLKWRSRARLITTQRLTQMSIIPDLLPSLDPTASVDIAFHGTKSNSPDRILPRPTPTGQRVTVQPGEFVASAVAEHAPKLEVQVFDKGERLVTIAVVDCDVPNMASDNFDYRCQFLATNVKLSPTQPTIRLASLNAAEQVILPWRAPYAVKGSPYHRVAIVVLEQPDGRLAAEKAKQKVERDGFVLRSFADRHALKPVGAGLFRVEWDEWMDGVMQRLGLTEQERSVELKRKKVEPLPYKKKDGARYR